MRDIFEDIFATEPVYPMESARRSSRPRLRARFYAKAETREGSDGFRVLLDGKPVRTPARLPLAAPVRPIAEAIAAEWEAQREVVDPAQMPLTRLANAIIDGVASAPQPVAAEIEKYLASDLLCYRAGEPDGLVARQAEHWDPVIDWARDEWGARFILTQGLVFARQPAEAIAAAARAIPTDPWRLGAASSVTSLTGSGLLALAMAHGRLDAEAAWAAANVDEDWNMKAWGRDELALARRAFRFAELQAAATALAAWR